MFSEGIYSARQIYTYHNDHGQIEQASSEVVTVRIGKTDIHIETKEGIYDGVKDAFTNSCYLHNGSSLHYDKVLNGLIGWWIQDGSEGFWKIEHFNRIS